MQASSNDQIEFNQKQNEHFTEMHKYILGKYNSHFIKSNFKQKQMFKSAKILISMWIVKAAFVNGSRRNCVPDGFYLDAMDCNVILRCFQS